MPRAPSSFLLLVVRPLAPSSVLPPNSDARGLIASCSTVDVRTFQSRPPLARVFRRMDETNETLATQIQ